MVANKSGKVTTRRKVLCYCMECGTVRFLVRPKYVSRESKTEVFRHCIVCDGDTKHRELCVHHWEGWGKKFWVDDKQVY